MSLTKLIDDLSENSASLHEAMLSGNAAAVEEATQAFRDVVEQLRAVDQWSGDPATRAKLVALMPQLDDHRALACLLADMTGQMHEMAAARARDTRPVRSARVGDRFA
ncbi:MAG: hypothetical protein J7494_05290 [Sphingobium sp.]|nr:hypothetical protein [Sphingobium sp.]